MDPSTVPFLAHLMSNVTLLAYQFLTAIHLPLHTPTPDETSPALSSYIDATPILYLTTSDQPDPPSSVKEELEYELDNFITLPQQPQNTNTLTIHRLTQCISSSESSNPACFVEETRAHREFK